MGTKSRRDGKMRLWLKPVAGLLAIVLAIWLLNVSNAGTEVEGCPRACGPAGGPAATGDGDTIRLLSLNMLHGFPHFESLPARLGLIGAEIERQQADLVLLQEVPWRPEPGNAALILAQQAGFNYLYLRANGNRRAIGFEEGEAILSRFPLQDDSHRELVPQARMFEHRVVLGATALTPLGKIRLYVSHLTNGDRRVNQRQVAFLSAFVGASSPVPAVVAGDFNATPDEPQIASLSPAWLDVFGQMPAGEAGFTCCVDDLVAVDEELEQRIDYVFLVPAEDGSSLAVVSAKRVLDQPQPLEGRWQWASDHAGLLVELARQP